MSDNIFVDGCLPQTDEDIELVAELQSRAISFPTLYNQGEMPVISWDTAFENYIAWRGDNIEMMLNDKSRSVFPWRVLQHLPDEYKGTISDKLYFSQGSRPSCMGHADDFAYRSSILSAIGLGAPLRYEVTNPYPLWWLSKNKSERGGQSVGKMSKAANEIGHFTMSSAGTNNTAISTEFEQNSNRIMQLSKKYQSALVYLTAETSAGLADQVFNICRAGFGIALGNSTAVNGSTVDSNNVQVATLGGRWAHATSFNSWMVRRGTPYVFWTNSHGKIYTKATFGEPHDGCWMTLPTCTTFLSTAFGYGKPYCVLPECVWFSPKSMSFDFEIPLPLNW
jgi:hypothetical protein